MHSNNDSMGRDSMDCDSMDCDSMDNDSLIADLREQAVEVLNAIIDPCSSAAGAPAGLVDMGLVHGLEVRKVENAISVSVVLGVTEPMCLMAGVFVAEARNRLQDIPAISDVDVTMDYKTIWTPDRMSDGYREQLQLKRQQQDQLLINAKQDYECV